MGKMKRKIKFKILIPVLIISILTISLVFYGGKMGYQYLSEKLSHKSVIAYTASTDLKVELLDKAYNKIDELVRGTKIDLYTKDIINKANNLIYNEIRYNNKKYYILKDNAELDLKKAVKEKEMYVRTNVTVYKESNKQDIESYIKKGEKILIEDYDTLNTDGSVVMYKVSYNDIKGYVYSKYLTKTSEEALKNYDETGNYIYHSTGLADPYYVGMAGALDFYPREKPKFTNNVMPDVVKSLYINGAAIKDVDEYIKIGKEIGANAFVVDIKDGYLAYKSLVAKDYAPYAYENALDELENYKANVKKLIDNGFYVIGRIVVFNDNQYAVSNPNDVIVYKSNNELFGGQSWLSPYCRNVWVYNVKLALEAVKEMKFNEIQFDYVRFPDRTGSVNNLLNFRDKYGETKAQAVQNFLMYAVDEIHKTNTYVSADVFGESAGAYVTGYGQYWPAISNVVDVISGMPYPDHFSEHAYGIPEIVWTVPEKLMATWGADVAKRQATIATPAIVRTWLQAYNTIHSPYIVYGDAELKAQIRGLFANQLTGGWMTWSGSSSLGKYESFTTAFKENYE